MAQISLRIEDDVKKKAEQVCADIGMSLSTAIKKLGREKRIPFEVSVDPFYSQENMTRLRESVAQMEATGGTVHEVDIDD